MSEEATDGPRGEADALAHDARNALNTVSLTMQLVERIVERADMPRDARERALARLAAAMPEVEKVRGAVEALRALTQRTERA